MDEVRDTHVLSKLSPQESLELFNLGIKSPPGDGLGGHVEDPSKNMVDGFS
jgi:hypothetical protein